jgi:hypothetical protein
LEQGLDGVVLKVDDMDDIIKLKVFITNPFNVPLCLTTKTLLVYDGPVVLNTIVVLYLYVSVQEPTSSYCLLFI